MPEIMDNYTKFSALEFTGAKTENVEGWEVTRPTNGLSGIAGFMKPTLDMDFRQCTVDGIFFSGM